MSEIAEAGLLEIGRKAAQLVEDPGTVERVAVTTGQDSTDQPAYILLLLIDRDAS